MKAASHVSPGQGGGADLSVSGAETCAPRDRLSVLMAGVAAGDRAALAALYDETSPFIFGLLTRMLGAGAAAEKTLVEVYSCVWREAASYRSGGVSALAWLVSTARGCALRKGRPHPAGGSTREVREQFASAPAGGAEKVPPPVESARAREALRGLGPEQRKALQLSYFYGPGRVEAALGLTAEEAKSLISNAIRSYSEIYKGAPADES